MSIFLLIFSKLLRRGTFCSYVHEAFGKASWALKKNKKWRTVGHCLWSSFLPKLSWIFSKLRLITDGSSNLSTSYALLPFRAPIMNFQYRSGSTCTAVYWTLSPEPSLSKERRNWNVGANVTFEICSDSFQSSWKQGKWNRVAVLLALVFIVMITK